MKSFHEYNKENPQIFERFVQLTFTLIRKGRDHYGAKGIIEIIRFNTITKAKGYPETEDFKINNNYAPDYARLFMDEYPKYEGFFNTRELKKARQ
jgi:hypothetical protein